MSTDPFKLLIESAGTVLGKTSLDKELWSAVLRSLCTWKIQTAKYNAEIHIKLQCRVSEDPELN